jgi:hypothetical protein
MQEKVVFKSLPGRNISTLQVFITQAYRTRLMIPNTEIR